jgi:hypothetical protein
VSDFSKEFFWPDFRFNKQHKPPPHKKLREDSKIIARKNDKDMKWIEIITIRMSRADLESLNTKLLLSVAEDYQANGVKRVVAYRHSIIETDLSVHLHWEAGRANSRQSPAAQHLIQVLEEYGLINHSVWIEEAIK